MKTKILNFWHSFSSSYWFVPAVMATISIALSLGTTAFDTVLPRDVTEKIGWLYSGGPEGARSILSTVAGSMITTAGVVFSITIVVLSLTSSQYGPRLLGNFIRDTGTQVVLGTFIATFIYCLFTLRVVRSGDSGSFVPHLSITIAIVLALASTAVLIYFIHHISTSIQADSIITAVYRDLNAAIDRHFPEQQDHGVGEPDRIDVRAALPEEFHRDGWPVASDNSGYLQAIDFDGLMRTAVENDFILSLHSRPGEFIAAGAHLVTVWPREHWDEKLSSRVNSSFIQGRQRTDQQDIEYLIYQLVEVALRALSPGINDPFTAMTCINWLSAGLGRIAQRKFPSAFSYDDKGNLRLVSVPVSFDQIVEAAFGQIRNAAASHVQVILCLFDAIAAIAPHIRVAERRKVLEHHAELVMQSGREMAHIKDDSRAIGERYERTLQVLRK
ncbi:MAG: DUF2254 domain-containing protein [Deltaproteobacteria bacterium]|nr:DUF2254 domain-containing protein [Deltaproteobacteria bacterium]TLN04824.1 MAG: DUF2254 domain-containing protein [bacterium]